MSNLTTNLRSAAAENFKLYPDCYPVKPTGDFFFPEYDFGQECENALDTLAKGYGENDGFYEAGLNETEVLLYVYEEFANHLSKLNEE